MPYHADLVAFDSAGRPSVIVEVKSKLGTSREWATRMRRNLVAHGIIPTADYFLLALPDRFYLWKDCGATPEEVPPTHEADAAPLLSPYFQRSNVRPETVSEAAFELIVAAWLSDLLRTPKPPQEMGEGASWLTDSGLIEAIRGGQMGHEVPV